MERLGPSLLWYALAYTVVTCIGILHTVYNIYVLHMSSMAEGPGMGEGYERTKPWHPLYNILVFPVCAWAYLHGCVSPSLVLALKTSLLWGIVTIVIDLIGWVLIRHPWALTAKEFYIDYQPWITLIYLAIFAAPFIAYAVMQAI